MIVFHTDKLLAADNWSDYSSFKDLLKGMNTQTIGTGPEELFVINSPENVQAELMNELTETVGEPRALKYVNRLDDVAGKCGDTEDDVVKSVRDAVEDRTVKYFTRGSSDYGRANERLVKTMTLAFLYTGLRTGNDIGLLF